jgi:hypothetical protein
VKKYWMGTRPGKTDDFGDPIESSFVDGKTRSGPWAIMSPRSWRRYGVDHLGLGRGQRYEKQDDGKWLKVEG